MSDQEIPEEILEPYLKQFMERRRCELSDIQSTDFYSYLKEFFPDIFSKFSSLKHCNSVLIAIKANHKPRDPKPTDLSRITSSDSKIQPPNTEFNPIQPKYTFENVGGLEQQKIELKKFFTYGLSMKSKQTFNQIGKIKPVAGILLHGPSGCGKTLLVEAVVGELKHSGINLSFFKITAPELSILGVQTESRLKTLIESAKFYSPSLVFIDEIDRIDKKLIPSVDSIFETISSDMEHDIFIIGATSDVEKVKELRRYGRFSREISLGIPDRVQRKEILDCLIKDISFHEIDTKEIAEQAEGYIGADLFGLVQEAALISVERFVNEHPEIAGNLENENDDALEDAFVIQEDFYQAMKIVQPSLRREGFTTTSCVKFDAIGGLDSVQKELRTAVIDAIKYSDLFGEYGHKSGSGIILYGPPGCGKTLLARAVANEAMHAAFISVKGPELLNKYLGESESAVRAVFQRARDSAPCIIFFDEIDAICPRRTNDSSNAAASRVVNQLLTEMDGVVGRGQIFVIGATNRLELVDEAMLRPGRLDKKIEVPRPNEEGRIDILNKIMMRVSPDYIDADIDLKAIASLTDGFSGAELDAIITESTEMAINLTKHLAQERELSDIRELPKEERGKITQQFLLEACEKIKHSKQRKSL